MNEADLENACIAWFQELGYAYKAGPDIAPRGAAPERKNFIQAILPGRLRDALEHLNPGLPAPTIDEAFSRLAQFAAGSLIEGNRELYQWIRDGVPVEIDTPDGKRSARAQVVDWSNAANDWLVVNQFSVKGKLPVRPDMVVFLNGLPLAVIELKNPADLQADVRKAYQQVRNYQDEIPQLFEPTAVNVISDGGQALVGSITTDFDRYAPWRYAEGIDPKGKLELEVLVRGLFRQVTFLTYLRHFILFQQLLLRGAGGVDAQLGRVRGGAGHHHLDDAPGDVRIMPFGAQLDDLVVKGCRSLARNRHDHALAIERLQAFFPVLHQVARQPAQPVVGHRDRFQTGEARNGLLLESVVLVLQQCIQVGIEFGVHLLVVGQVDDAGLVENRDGGLVFLGVSHVIDVDVVAKHPLGVAVFLRGGRASHAHEHGVREGVAQVSG